MTTMTRPAEQYLIKHLGRKKLGNLMFHGGRITLSAAREIVTWDRQRRKPKRLGMTRKQFNRLNVGLPEGVHTILAGPVTDEQIEVAIRLGCESRKRAKAKYPECFK